MRVYPRRVRLSDLLPMSDCRMFPSICALISLVARRSLLPLMMSPCRCDRSCRPVAPVMRNTTKLPEPVIPELLGCDIACLALVSAAICLLAFVVYSLVLSGAETTPGHSERTTAELSVAPLAAD